MLLKYMEEDPMSSYSVHVLVYAGLSGQNNVHMYITVQECTCTSTFTCRKVMSNWGMNNLPAERPFHITLCYMSSVIKLLSSKVLKKGPHIFITIWLSHWVIECGLYRFESIWGTLCNAIMQRQKEASDIMNFIEKVWKIPVKRKAMECKNRDL